MCDFSVRASPSLRNHTSFYHKPLLNSVLLQLVIAICVLIINYKMENMMNNKNLNIALLIDADNISAKYIKTIIDEITSNYGTVSIKRAYGDWTTDTLKPWKTSMVEYSLTPIQQFSYRRGKNSTDSAMIIDAMDILYTKEIDAFCLATSDCDFTKIASRLRESGKLVIGLGESKTHKSFISSCNEFKFIDVLFNNGNGEEKNDDKLVKSIEKSSITPIEDIKNCIFDLINAGDGKTQLGGLKSTIKTKFPDFDERNYGYSKFSTFVGSFSELTLDSSSTSTFVSLQNDCNNDVDAIRKYVCESMKKVNKSSYTSAEIQNIIAKEYKNFKLKNLGYSNMKSFLKSFNELKVDKDGKYSAK